MDACQIWLRRSLEHRLLFVLPEIAGYEIRRELLLGKKINGLKLLDEFKSAIYYYPICQRRRSANDSEMMLTAAKSWVESRQGRTRSLRFPCYLTTRFLNQLYLQSGGSLEFPLVCECLSIKFLPHLPRRKTVC